jgi:hypothetical protein
MVTVTAVADGTIRIDSVAHPDGTRRRWLPEARDRFVEEETGVQLIATRNDNGHVVRFASSLASGVMEYERAPPWLRFAPRLMLLSLTILLLSILSGPATRAFCRSRLGRSACGPLLPAGARPRSGQPWVGLILFTSLAWLVFLTLSGGPGTFPGSGLLLLALSLCALLSCFGAAKLVLDAVYVCLDTARSVTIKFILLLRASSAAVMAATFMAFGFVLPSLNF